MMINMNNFFINNYYIFITCNVIIVLLFDFSQCTTTNFTQCKPSLTTVWRASKFYKKTYCSGELVFSDEFNYFDTKLWYHVITEVDPGNKQFQWYVNSRENSFANNGLLSIRPTIDIRYHRKLQTYFDFLDLPFYYTNVVKSARINTQHSFAYRYGKIEVRAKLPTGDWLWPAIWLMPRENVYGPWPMSGEVDVMESRGNRKLIRGNVNIGVENMGSTLHYGLDRQHDPWRLTHYERFSSDFGKRFHNYTVLWSPGGFEFYLDGEMIGEINVPDGGFWEFGKFEPSLDNPWKGQPKIAPFDQYFHIILNVAVGGNSFFPDNVKNEGYNKPWKNTSPTAAQEFYEAINLWLPTWQYTRDESPEMQIDYIRVYAL